MVTTPNRHALVYLMLSLMACAPTVLSTRTEKVLLRSESVVGPGHDRIMTAFMREHPDGATLELISSETCEQRPRRVVRRSEVVEQKAAVGAQVAFYMLAAIGIGFGTALVADAHNVPESGDPATRNIVSQPGAYAWGLSHLGLGAGFLGLGIGTTLRGGDRVTDLGEATELNGQPQPVTCNKRPTAHEAVTLAITGLPPLKLWPTDEDGLTTVRWSELMAVQPANIDSGPVSGSSASASSRWMVEVAGQVVPLELEPSVVAAVAKLRSEREAERAASHAHDALASARKLLSVGDFDGAERQLDTAESFGGDALEVRLQLKNAREAKGRGLLANAWQAVKANKPDEARDIQRSAAALGMYDEKLSEAIERTPAAKQQRRAEEYRIREAERQAVRQRLAEQEYKAREAEREARRQIAEAQLARRQAFDRGECPQKRIVGSLVGRVSSSLYEFIHIETGVVGYELQARPDLGQLGQIGDGYNTVPQIGEVLGNHALLVTRQTAFGSTGRFQLCVRATVEKRRVQTNSGFSESWDVFTEDVP